MKTVAALILSVIATAALAYSMLYMVFDKHGNAVAGPFRDYNECVRVARAMGPNAWDFSCRAI